MPRSPPERPGGDAPPHRPGDVQNDTGPQTGNPPRRRSTSASPGTRGPARAAERKRAPSERDSSSEISTPVG